MRVAARAAGLALALAVSACQLPQPARQSDSILYITGFADSAELAALEKRIQQESSQGRLQSQPVDPAWANRTLAASADEALPSMGSSYETRRLMARRAAIFEAYRDLAEQIERMSIPGRGSVHEYAAADESIRRQIEALVYTAAVRDDPASPGGGMRVHLTLNAAPLASFLPPRNASDMASARLADLEAQRRRLRDLVQKSAEQDARRRLLDAVKSQPLNSALLIGQAMQRDPQMAQHVMGMIQAAPIQSVEFAAEGGCEAQIQFDVRRIRSSRGWGYS